MNGCMDAAGAEALRQVIESRTAGRVSEDAPNDDAPTPLAHLNAAINAFYATLLPAQADC